MILPKFQRTANFSNGILLIADYFILRCIVIKMDEKRKKITIPQLHQINTSRMTGSF